MKDVNSKVCHIFLGFLFITKHEAVSICKKLYQLQQECIVFF